MTDPTPFSGATAPKPAAPPVEPAPIRLGSPLGAETNDSEAQGHQAQSRIQLWMHRISVFLFVLVSAIAGMLLIILPWTPGWTDNYLFLSYPMLRTIVSSGFFRGLCSGLGLLDVWIGFWEALHYHEQ